MINSKSPMIQKQKKHHTFFRYMNSKKPTPLADTSTASPIQPTADIRNKLEFAEQMSCIELVDILLRSVFSESPGVFKKFLQHQLHVKIMVSHGHSSHFPVLIFPPPINHIYSTVMHSCVSSSSLRTSPWRPINCKHLIDVSCGLKQVWELLLNL